MAAKFEFPFTQNSTIVAFLCTLLIAIVLTMRVELTDMALLETFLRLFHLGSFSTWLGVQVWVTFFAGITMYRYLPRHMFGFIQGKLFPKYFFLGTILSSITLITFLIENPFPSWERKQTIQGWSLLVGLLSALCNMLYLEPQNTKTALAKHKYEKEVQAGQAVGKVEDDKLTELRKIPEYVALEKRFFWLHTCSAIVNLISLCVTGIHLWYLSCNLVTV